MGIENGVIDYRKNYQEIEKDMNTRTSKKEPSTIILNRKKREAVSASKSIKRKC